MEHTENKTITHDTEKTVSWEQQTAMKVSGISILVNLLLSVFKLIAGIVAHSGAMISDAIHSASDVGSTFIVIIGVRLSAKKSDKEHQYGHERMECVSSIVLAGMLLVTGLGIGVTGARDIVKSTSGGTIAIPGTLALIAAVVSIVVKEWMFWYTRGAAKKLNSGALMADAWHHRSDALSSIGAFTVSYTHLDVYKRQGQENPVFLTDEKGNFLREKGIHVSDRDYDRFRRIYREKPGVKMYLAYGYRKRHAYDEATMEVEEYKMGEHIGVLLVYELPDSVKEKETEAQAYAAVWDIMMAIQKKLPRAFVYYGQDSVEDGGKRYDGLGVFLPIHKFADRLEKMIGIADEIVMK